MPEPRDATGRSPFEYAIVRVIPRVERGEGFNAGIVLMCRPRRYLGARTHLDERLLVAMSPDCDPEIVRALVAAGADLQFVGELRHSLEEVYLQLMKATRGEP